MMDKINKALASFSRHEFHADSVGAHPDLMESAVSFFRDAEEGWIASGYCWENLPKSVRFIKRIGDQLIAEDGAVLSSLPRLGHEYLSLDDDGDVNDGGWSWDGKPTFHFIGQFDNFLVDLRRKVVLYAYKNRPAVYRRQRAAEAARQAAAKIVHEGVVVKKDNYKGQVTLRRNSDGVEFSFRHFDSPYGLKLAVGDKVTFRVEEKILFGGGAYNDVLDVQKIGQIIKKSPFQKG